jgi:16S rRNA U516 pseudouridylate synthase RsuA-like enzyme
MQRLHIVLHKPVEYVCSRVKDVPQTKLIYDLFPVRDIKEISSTKKKKSRSPTDRSRAS